MPEPQHARHLTDEMVAGRRADDALAHLPGDMPRWMARTIVLIDGFSLWVGHIVAWVTMALIGAMVYEVFARYLFTAPTVWAYDISRMLYGALFVLGAGYALSKGVHIRSDFLYRNWSVKTQGRVDLLLYLVFYFPTMLVLLWVSSNWAWTAIDRGERGMDTSWMPLLGPVRSCLPIGVLFLIIQGVSELLKSGYAATRGRWPE
jgi:TRAP-type mannitol/chloroaromatic compound transport system permease small subunit